MLLRLEFHLRAEVSGARRSTSSRAHEHAVVAREALEWRRRRVMHYMGYSSVVMV